MENFQGEVYPVMLTPFHDDKSIDFAALRELTEFYISTGSTGLFANCLSSEMFELSEDERIQITETVVKQVNGRQKVVATGTFGYNQDENIEFIKRISDTGIEAVIINSNQLATETESDDVWKLNMENILNSTGNISFGVYECPVPYKRLLSPKLTEWMGSTGRFYFLKETSCDLNQIRPKIAAVKGTSLKIYNANIPTVLDSMQLGVKGIASIASNYYPELISYLAQNFNVIDDKIEKLNTFLTIVDPLIHEYYPFSSKHFLKLRGMKINTTSRVKNEPLSYQGFVKLNKLLEAFEIISEELKIDIHKY